MGEKRKEKREIVEFFLEVFDVKTGEMIGHMVDITRNGMHLVSREQIPVNREFFLKTRLPGSVPDKPYVEFRAISKWSRNDDDSYFYDTGFEIFDIAPEYVRQIIDVLNR